MEYFRIFGELDKNDAALAGGKGASLGEMTQAGIPVPPGFVILSAAFEKFLEGANLKTEIDAILGFVDLKESQSVELASKKIQNLILGAEISQEITDGIKQFFNNLDSKYVAVRSSATAEDSVSAAWAGQLDSYLNTSKDDLLENVKKCWASLFTPRAIFYRFEKKLDNLKISVAVVVQKMVESEKSGIAFSVHPVTQDSNQLIVEAGYGLGEAIVSGQITPNSYVVEKESRRIADKNNQKQMRGLYRAKNGGNEWRDINEELGLKQVLSDEEIFELSELILKIEKHYGLPCDIEWACDQGKFYIVQSRPITTLIGERTLVEKFLSLIGEDKIAIFNGDFYPLFSLFDWYNYYDSRGVMKNVYPLYFHKKGPSVKISISFTKYLDVSKSAFRRYLDGEFDISRTGYTYQSLKTGINTLYDKYCVAGSWDEAELLSDLDKTVEGLQKLDALTFFIETLDQQVITQELYKRILDVRLEEIWKVSQILDFISFDSQNSQEIIAVLQKGLKFEKLRYIFTNYTHCPSVKEVEGTVKKLDLGQEIKKLEESKEEVERNVKVKESMRQTLSSNEQNILKFIDWASWLRDDRKALINKGDVLLFDLVSKLYGKWGFEQDLVPLSFAFEVLKGKDFNLKIISAVRQRKDKLVLVYYGKDKYDEDSVQSKDEIRIIEERFLAQNKPQDDNVIKGEVASPGYAKGIVRIIQKRREFRSFKDGEILVTGMTRPEFIPLMKKAAAIITDEGGITSHAAILSRELKKPCIIGTRVATQILRTGDMVELDTNLGIVKIVK
jgi:phosphoenolpyruvate synthase/pyruvate phosphate dikinase